MHLESVIRPELELFLTLPVPPPSLSHTRRQPPKASDKVKGAKGGANTLYWCITHLCWSHILLLTPIPGNRGLTQRDGVDLAFDVECTFCALVNVGHLLQLCVADHQVGSILLIFLKRGGGEPLLIYSSSPRRQLRIAAGIPPRDNNRQYSFHGSASQQEGPKMEVQIHGQVTITPDATRGSFPVLGWSAPSPEGRVLVAATTL